MSGFPPDGSRAQQHRENKEQEHKIAPPANGGATDFVWINPCLRFNRPSLFQVISDYLL
jgi:hypothetical protein